MKKILFILIAVFCLMGCSKSKYKKTAVDFLKTKLPYPATLDTIKFLKPDSIYTSFYSTKEYVFLKYSRDSLIDEKNLAEAAKVSATLANRIKTYPKTITGWDVNLIYKAKNKKGIVQTDTCRFMFNSNLSAVNDVYGVDL